MIVVKAFCDLCHHEEEGADHGDLFNFMCGVCGEEYCNSCPENPVTCTLCKEEVCGHCMMGSGSLCDSCEEDEKDEDD